MLKKVIHVALIICLVLSELLILLAKQTKTTVQAAVDITIPTAPFPEADDFATSNFRDAMDMSEFSDISQNFNGLGHAVSLTNFQVLDGIFSAKSAGNYTKNIATFTPLYPGTPIAMNLGKNQGEIHSINSSRYSCLYLAMKVDSPVYKSGDPFPDMLRVSWYADQSMMPVGLSPNGTTNGYFTYPNAWQAGQSVHRWQLYKINLNSQQIYPGSATWTSRPSWVGLQINPTMFANVTFQVDWIRLTSCKDDQKYQATISWQPNGNVNSIWLRPQGTTRDIQVATGVNGNSGAYTLDTKGLPPGSYQVELGTLTSCCSQTSTGLLTVNQSPIPTFVHPSRTSGEDYATSAGSPWNMDNPGNVTSVVCSSTWSFSNSNLVLDIPYPAIAPANCLGSQIHEVDSQVYLDLPATLAQGGLYRYLTLRFYQNGSVAEPLDGMMGRWIWTLGDYCTAVSHDIPYDVGWNTYSIDLYDPFNGTPAGDAPKGCYKGTWKDAGKIIKLRFDPAENWTGNQVPAMMFNQQLDWIKLTKMDMVPLGQPYTIQLLMNKPSNNIQSITYYYTSDLNNPTQHTAVRLNSNQAPTGPTGNIKIFLPAITNGAVVNNGYGAGITYSWDTSGVSTRGYYYVCAATNDGINQTTYCSDAQVWVY